MNVFTKRNATPFNQALLREAQGLECLRRTLHAHAVTELSIPTIVSVDECQLTLQSIHQSAASSEQMAILGRGLANLHRDKFEHFGLEYDNFIGLNPQLNGIDSCWGKFFIEQRLLIQITFINDRKIRAEFDAAIRTAYEPLKAFLNNSQPKPSLVHGDLWSGNVLFDTNKVWLIDPAIYYADREVDIAMTEMFGGFSPSFYQAYQETYPLSTDYTLRKEIYNLYHYLNHFNLFGNGYLDACQKRVKLIQNL